MDRSSQVPACLRAPCKHTAWVPMAALPEARPRLFGTAWSCGAGTEAPRPSFLPALCVAVGGPTLTAPSVLPALRPCMGCWGEWILVSGAQSPSLPPTHARTHGHARTSTRKCMHVHAYARTHLVACEQQRREARECGQPVRQAPQPVVAEVKTAQAHQPRQPQGHLRQLREAYWHGQQGGIGVG